MNVMLDLETLGNNSNSVIVSIGAVMFDSTVVDENGYFYANVDPESCVQAGLKMDASTVMWWMQQSDQARSAFNVGSSPLAAALIDFSNWIPPGSTVWGNGATFDNVILSNAYLATGIPKPWKYNGDRCYRTLKALYQNIKADARSGVYHNALDDAIHQAKHASKILRHIVMT